MYSLREYNNLTSVRYIPAGTDWAWSRSMSPLRFPCWTLQNVPRLVRGTNASKETGHRPKLYLSFIDESGTHGDSSVTVVAGLMLHEEDVWHLQQRLDSFLSKRLRALGQDPSLFELHATELWRGKKEWSAVRRTDRHKILDGAYFGVLFSAAGLAGRCRLVRPRGTWRRSASAAGRSRLLTNAWYRQSGHSSA